MVGESATFRRLAVPLVSLPEANRICGSNIVFLIYTRYKFLIMYLACHSHVPLEYSINIFLKYITYRKKPYAGYI